VGTSGRSAAAWGTGSAAAAAFFFACSSGSSTSFRNWALTILAMSAADSGLGFE
jgi:hypothetical protein